MRKGILFVLKCSIAVIFTFTCNRTICATSSSPNNVSIQTQTVNNGNNNQLELAKEQLRGDFYKEALDKYKSAFYFIIGLVVTFVGIATWRNGREYKEAVADANKALDRIQSLSDKAEDHCEKARDYERQAHEKLERIETTVTSKLKDIEEQAKTSLEKIKEEGKKQIDESIKEGERQRKVSELWSQALKLYEKEDYEAAADCYKQIVEDFKEETDWAFNNWGLALADIAKKQDGEPADKLYNQALEKYQKAIELKPDYHEAFYNWGLVFCKWAQRKSGEQSDKLFTQACEKFQKATELKSDLLQAFNSWGGTLLYWSKLKKGKEKEEILKQAEEKLLKAESIKTGSGSYNLACLFGIRGDKEICRKWLEIAEKTKSLPIRKHAMVDKDLKIVWDEEWFKKLRFKDE